MDAIQRAYAHTAWTSLDPLKGLDLETKRALLLMPSTFRERLKLAPWVDRDQRRVVVADILRERRLAFELTEGVDTRTRTQNKEPHELGPYYEMRLHRLAQDRRAQDLDDWRADARARLDYQRREQTRERYRDLIALLEERLHEVEQSRPLALPARSFDKQRKRSRSRERGGDR